MHESEPVFLRSNRRGSSKEQYKKGQCAALTMPHGAPAGGGRDGRVATHADPAHAHVESALPSLLRTYASGRTSQATAATRTTSPSESPRTRRRKARIDDAEEKDRLKRAEAVLDALERFKREMRDVRAKELKTKLAMQHEERRLREEIENRKRAHEEKAREQAEQRRREEFQRKRNDQKTKERHKSDDGSRAHGVAMHAGTDGLAAAHANVYASSSLNADVVSVAGDRRASRMGSAESSATKTSNQMASSSVRSEQAREQAREFAVHEPVSPADTALRGKKGEDVLLGVAKDNSAHRVKQSLSIPTSPRKVRAPREKSVQTRTAEVAAERSVEEMYNEMFGDRYLKNDDEEVAASANSQRAARRPPPRIHGAKNTQEFTEQVSVMYRMAQRNKEKAKKMMSENPPPDVLMYADEFGFSKYVATPGSRSTGPLDQSRPVTRPTLDASLAGMNFSFGSRSAVAAATQAAATPASASGHKTSLGDAAHQQSKSPELYAYGDNRGAQYAPAVNYIDRHNLWQQERLNSLRKDMEAGRGDGGGAESLEALRPAGVARPRGWEPLDLGSLEEYSPARGSTCAFACKAGSGCTHNFKFIKSTVWKVT